jgi:hypothetical protein
MTFHRVKPQFNSDPAKAFLPFGAVCLIKNTEGQRATLASKMNLKLKNVARVKKKSFINIQSLLK